MLISYSQLSCLCNFLSTPSQKLLLYMKCLSQMCFLYGHSDLIIKKKKIIPSRCWTSSLHINEFSGIYALAHFVPNTRDKKYTEPLCPFCILLNSCNINLSEESTWNVYLGAQPNISKKIHLGLCGHQSPTWTPLKLPQLIHGHTCLPWKHDRESKIRDTPF